MEKLNHTYTSGTRLPASKLQAIADKVDEIIDGKADDSRVDDIEAQLNAIGTTVANLEQELVTVDEYRQLTKQLKYYFVAKDATDKARKKCWRIYLRTQLVGEFNVDGSLTIPKFPIRFPFRFA